MIWNITDCDEHVEIAHKPDAKHPIKCKCAPGLYLSGFVCHRCSCFTCNVIRARFRHFYPPKQKAY